MAKKKTKKTKKTNWFCVCYSQVDGEILASEGPIIICDEVPNFPKKGSVQWTQNTDTAEWRTEYISEGEDNEGLVADMIKDGVMSWDAFCKYYPEVLSPEKKKKEKKKVGRVPRDEQLEPVSFDFNI